MAEPLPHKTPGQALRRSRIAAGASLREIALHADLYPVQLGQLERDLLPDPDSEILAHAFYAVVGHLLGKLAAAHARIEELEGADHG